MMIGGGAYASAARQACGEASRRAPAERTTTDGPERVRAFRRATRSAMGSGWSRCPKSSASLARHASHAGTRPRQAWQRLHGGGPGPLTEDRQKTETRP